MSEQEKILVIDETNIQNYIVEDRETLLTYGKKNKEGFPVVWPTKNKRSQTVVFSFVDAQIYDAKGNLLDEEVANFDVLDEEEFNKNKKDAKTKIKFLSALLSTSRYVKGGVYFKGEYYTSKLTKNDVYRLTKNVMNSYFHIEDKELLLEYFDKMEMKEFPLYWPTKFYDHSTPVIFSAVNAYVSTSDDEVSTKPDTVLNFDIRWGDTFDLTKEEDLNKAETIRSLLDSHRIVRGFYYKGKLLPKKLSREFKLYLEKTFIKKNFTVNQRDYLFTYVTKDSKSNFPLFWPMRDDSGREIVISVVNATANWIGKEKYSNFDVYTDEFFDLNQEEFQIKLQIIQQLLSGKSLVSGGLYFDGVLIPGNNSTSEILRRKEKVEKALKIYIANNEEFLKITTHFSVEDRVRFLRISAIYDHYYTDDMTKVKKKDETYHKEDPVVVKFDRTNVVGEYGDYLLKEDYSASLTADAHFDNDESLWTVLKALVHPHKKIRGAIYYKGVNIAQAKRSLSLQEFTSKFLPAFLGPEKYDELKASASEEFYRFELDKKTKMPKYWTTKDKSGREVLLSVIDSDVHFKIGRTIIKACNNMNFNVYVGETFGLVGESGSGKTTISRAILGINKLTKGGIYFKGRLISGEQTKNEIKSTKKNIQMIFQDPAASLNERANIDYIVSEGLYNFHLFKTKEERLAKVSKMMNSVGLLPEHLSRYPHEFSGGQRQRIGIARALVIEPQLVLADEPISALDVSIRAQVLNLLKKLQKEEDLTYIFIAHDLSIIRYISDRIAVMHQGYIVELGPADEIYSHPIHPYTKSLLTAIPQPDPKTKNDRKKLVYVNDMDYSKCRWIEVQPEHYILGTDEKVKEWLK